MIALVEEKPFVFLLAELALQGVIPPLVELLESELEDVLVNAVSAIRVLCEGHSGNKTQVAENGNASFDTKTEFTFVLFLEVLQHDTGFSNLTGAIAHLVEFLQTDSDVLQAASAAAIASVTANHKANQDAIVDDRAVK